MRREDGPDRFSETNRQTALQIQSISILSRSYIQRMRDETAHASQSLGLRLAEQTTLHTSHQKALQDIETHLGAISTNQTPKSEIISLRAEQQSSLEQIHSAIVQHQTAQIASVQALEELRLGQEVIYQTVAASMRRLEAGVLRASTAEHSALAFAGSSSEKRDSLGSDAGDGSTVCITATHAFEKCPPGCRCKCHQQTSFRSPKRLRDVLGKQLNACKATC